MRNVLLFLKRVAGFHRSAPPTRLRRYVRRSKHALTAAALLYFALLAFPQVLFAHHVSEAGITIYSRAPLPPETTERIAEIRSLVSQSELAVPGRSERLFLCNSRSLFRVFAPANADSFAVSSPGTGHVFVAEADLARDVARSSTPEYNTRSFSAVAAHEITHGLIRQRLGFARAIRLPAWVAEGYCDYVAGESSFPEAEGLKMLRAGERRASQSFRYFTYRQMVRHLIDDRGMAFADVVARAGDAAAVEAETLHALKGAGTE